MGEYAGFVQKIHRLLDLDLSLYKEAQMKRRLTSLRNKRGYHDFTTYYEALQQDEVLLEEFVDRITINVSEFYRNPLRWEILEKKILPQVVKRKRQIRIWSAACSTGEEAYSLAMICEEYFPHIHYTIIATDIDDKMLQTAKRGTYKGQSLKELPDNKKSKYFIYKNDHYYIDDGLKKKITFKKHNLLKDRYPADIDLIVCRNVLIYFTDEAKELIYQQFSDVLLPGGMLFIGSTEQIFNPDEYELAFYDTFFYQKQK